MTALPLWQHEAPTRPTPLPFPQRAVAEQAAPSTPVGAAHAGFRRAPLTAVAGLSALIWGAFAGLAVGLRNQSIEADLAGMGSVLLGGTAIIAVVLVTLTVVHRRLAGGQWGLLLVPAAVVLAGLTQGRLALVAAGISDSTEGLWRLAAHLFDFTGMVVAVAAVAAEFGRRASTTQEQLFDSKVAACTDGIRRHARQAVEAGHRHDVRSALFVVDGAARTLATRYADLSEEDRRAMADIVANGIERLTEIVDLRLDDLHELPVAVVVKGVVHGERKAGHIVHTALPSGLRVVGRPADLAAVLHTLAGSVRRGGHLGAAEVVRVRGEVHGTNAVLFVEPGDHNGPSPAPEGWEPLSAARLQPELRSADGEDDSLDLYVAARLVADQGGDLWVAGHPGGPLSYAVRIPSAQSTEEEA